MTRAVSGVDALMAGSGPPEGSARSGRIDQRLQSVGLRPEQLAPAWSQPVAPPTGIVVRVLGILKSLDQVFLGQLTDGAVQGGRPQLHAPLGALLHQAADGVPVLGPIG